MSANPGANARQTALIGHTLQNELWSARAQWPRFRRLCCQRPHENAKVADQRMELKSDGVGGEGLACSARVGNASTCPGPLSPAIAFMLTTSVTAARRPATTGPRCIVFAAFLGLELIDVIHPSTSVPAPALGPTDKAGNQGDGWHPPRE